MSSSPPLRTPAQTAEQLSTTEGALAQMRYMGKGPRFVKLGGRAIRYRQEDIDAWIESCIRSRTDDVASPVAALKQPSLPATRSRPRAKPRSALAASQRSDGSAA